MSKPVHKSKKISNYFNSFLSTMNCLFIWKLLLRILWNHASNWSALLQSLDRVKVLLCFLRLPYWIPSFFYTQVANTQLRCNEVTQDLGYQLLLFKVLSHIRNDQLSNSLLILYTIVTFYEIFEIVLLMINLKEWWFFIFIICKFITFQLFVDLANNSHSR